MRRRLKELRNERVEQRIETSLPKEQPVVKTSLDIEGNIIIEELSVDEHNIDSSEIKALESIREISLKTPDMDSEVERRARRLNRCYGESVNTRNPSKPLSNCMEDPEDNSKIEIIPVGTILFVDLDHDSRRLYSSRSEVLGREVHRVITKIPLKVVAVSQNSRYYHTALPIEELMNMKALNFIEDAPEW